MSVMKLHEWRLTHNLTMAEAAARFGLESARTFQRYETGENRPDAPLVEIILAATEGNVSIVDLHQQRLAWLRANKPEAFPQPMPEAAE